MRAHTNSTPTIEHRGDAPRPLPKICARTQIRQQMFLARGGAYGDVISMFMRTGSTPLLGSSHHIAGGPLAVCCGCLWPQHFLRPTVGGGPVDEADVPPLLVALPELDRLRTQRIQRPVRGYEIGLALNPCE